MSNLRPYQLDVLADLRRALRAKTAARALAVAPTGSGKTILAAELIRQEAGAKVLFLAHRRELIHQARNKLVDAGIKPGIIPTSTPTSSPTCRSPRFRHYGVVEPRCRRPTW